LEIRCVDCLRCGDSAGLGSPQGFHLLTAANGKAVPVLLGATATCNQLLYKTSLFLAPDGSFSPGVLIVTDCRGSGGSQTMALANLAGSYSMSAGILMLTPAAPGSPPIVATFDATHLRATIPASPQTFPVSLRHLHVLSGSYAVNLRS
jgi:hypothetical protein